MNKLLQSRRTALGLIAFGASPAVRLLGAPSVPAPAGHVPERMILTWSGDPSTTQSVTWETATALTSPQGQVAKMSPSPKFESGAVTVAGTVTSAGAPDPGHYAVTFTGLEPGAHYLCRVGDGKSWSEWNAFRTAAATSSCRVIPFLDAALSAAELSVATSVLLADPDGGETSPLLSRTTPTGALPALK